MSDKNNPPTGWWEDPMGGDLSPLMDDVLRHLEGENPEFPDLLGFRDLGSLEAERPGKHPRRNHGGKVPADVPDLSRLGRRSY